MNKYKIKNFFYLLSLTIFLHLFLFDKDYFFCVFFRRNKE